MPSAQGRAGRAFGNTRYAYEKAMCKYYKGWAEAGGNDAFPPCFRFPPISEEFFILRVKFSQIYLFLKNVPFSSSKISRDPFISHRLQILNFTPNFPVSVHFPLILEKKYYFPLFLKISLHDFV